MFEELFSILEKKDLLVTHFSSFVSESFQVWFLLVLKVRRV